MKVQELIINGVRYYRITRDEPAGHEIIRYSPPDDENPYWEFTRRDGRVILATGNITLIIEEKVSREKSKKVSEEEQSSSEPALVSLAKKMLKR